MSSEEELSTSSDENMEQEDNLELEGDIISNYNVICELGRGAFSIVWLAYCIKDNKFYALKVQNPNEYKDGLSEIKFVERLPKDPAVFNNIIEYFVEVRNNKKYLCSVWNLHCSNIDGIIRKGGYNEGLPINIVNSIMCQLLTAIKILHKKFRVFHGDIKPDNILVKGINARDEYIVNNYNKYNFFDQYSEAKKNYWIGKGKKLDTIERMSKEEKKVIRRGVHKKITTQVMEELEQTDISNHIIDNKYIENIKISLADFGTHCEEDNYYEEPFGTRYYMAPEIILMGRCSFPVDIWAIGCTYYEMLTGKILFDPIKCSNHSRDYYHLCLINETCGLFPTKLIKKTKYGSHYLDNKGKVYDYELGEMNRLDNKLSNKLGEGFAFAKGILKEMLKIDNNGRICIEQLYSYFSS